MQEIIVRRRGQYQQESATFSGGNQVNLIYSDDSFESTIDVIPKGTVGCLYSMPVEEFEFNYILRGKMELFGKGEKILLEAGDTFTFYILK